MSSSNNSSSTTGGGKDESSGNTTAENKAKTDLGLLEEDDEFEEFPAEGKPKMSPR